MFSVQESDNTFKVFYICSKYPHFDNAYQERLPYLTGTAVYFENISDWSINYNVYVFGFCYWSSWWNNPQDSNTRTLLLLEPQFSNCTRLSGHFHLSWFLIWYIEKLNSSKDATFFQWLTRWFLCSWSKVDIIFSDNT